MSTHISTNTNHRSADLADADPLTETAIQSPVSHASHVPVPAASERHASAPRSREEAEERYIAARDIWTEAMHRALSGRPADLASLAIAQEAYEMAAAERERWINGPQVAISIDPAAAHKGLEAVVGQEFAWRKVHDASGRRPNRVVRVLRRLTGRG